jgi:hypothetical protein
LRYTGRNGVFTQDLFKLLRTPGLEIKDVFNRTGKAVGTVTSGKQVPAVYNQFFDAAYLAGAAATTSPASVTATGNLSIQLATAGTVSVAGLSAAVPAGTVPVNDLAAGSQTVTVRVEP